MRLLGMGVALAAAGAAAAVAVPVPASARDVVVQVDARAGPWLNKANPKMRYGKGGEIAPVVIGGLADVSGETVEIFAAQGASTQVGGADVGVEGVAGEAVDDMPGAGKKYYPSLYAPKVLYPTNRHALMAVFVDADGKLVGRPFAVGQGVRLAIPDGAASLSLGFNDVEFAGNGGAMTVTVVVPDS